MPPWCVHRHNEGDCPPPSFYRQPPIPGGPSPQPIHRGAVATPIHTATSRASITQSPRRLTSLTSRRWCLLGAMPPRCPPCPCVSHSCATQADRVSPPRSDFTIFAILAPWGPFVFRCRYFTSTGPGCQAGQRKIVVINCNTRPIQSPPINPGPSTIPMHHHAPHVPPTPDPGPARPITRQTTTPMTRPPPAASPPKLLTPP